MRISNKILTNKFTDNVNNSLDKINNFNNEIASGKKVTKPSDAPDDISLILQFKRSIANLDQYSKNIDAGLSFMRTTDAALLATTEQVRLANQLSVEAANDPTLFSDSAIKGLITDIDGIKEEIQIQANKQLSGKYIFSGYSTKTQPFISSSNGYRGDSFNILTKIADDKTVPTNITGDVAFRESSVTGKITDISPDFVGGAINLFDSNIPAAEGKLSTIIAAPGNYTGATTGNYRVEVQTNNTNVGEIGGLVLELYFNDGTGGDVLIETSAPLVGAAERGTVTFANTSGLDFSVDVDFSHQTTLMAPPVGTTYMANSFDVAGSVRYTVSDGTNTSADIVFNAGTVYTQTDITNVINAALAGGTPAAPNVSFKFDVDGQPVFSIDPASTNGVMEFSNIANGTNSTTKGRMYDMFRITEGYKNIFGVLDDLKQGITDKDQEAIQLTIKRLEVVETEVLKNEGIVGARERAMENNSVHLSDVKNERIELMSALEDADPTESITGLNNQQNSYESILYYGSLLNRKSLLDYIS